MLNAILYSYAQYCLWSGAILLVYLFLLKTLKNLPSFKVLVLLRQLLGSDDQAIRKEVCWVLSNIATDHIQNVGSFPHPRHA